MIKNLGRSFLCVSLALLYACGDSQSALENIQTKAPMVIGQSQHALGASGKQVQGNPFVGAKMYVDPDYTKDVKAAKLVGSPNASMLAKMKIAQSFPTAIWLDSRAAITGSEGRSSLVAHLEAAVAQQEKTANKTPIAVPIVVYDLPDRDCAALASNGELVGVADLPIYKSEFIDVIYDTFTSNPNFANLRLILIIEPDSLPNLVTNQGYPICAEALAQNIYTDGVTYAIQKLGSLPNTYVYLDIAHAGWLGWPANMEPAVTLYTNLIKTAGNGDYTVVRGFVTNTANYTPLVEPFVNPNNSPSLMTGQNSFYQWNPILDETSYVKALAQLFVAAGFTDIGFITDTGRNGWPIIFTGQPIDRRVWRGNWCNPAGTGVGVRPQTSPGNFPLYDAFVFVKPPGQSDGASTPGVTGYDPSCNASINSNLVSLPGAPQAGLWFQNQFEMLLSNATPALE